MSRLCGRLGLEFDPCWIDRYAESISQIRLDRESWKAGSTDAIAPRSTFRDSLDDARLCYVLEHTDPQLFVGQEGRL